MNEEHIVQLGLIILLIIYAGVLVFVNKKKPILKRSLIFHYSAGSLFAIVIATFLSIYSKFSFDEFLFFAISGIVASFLFTTLTVVPIRISNKNKEK